MKKALILLGPTGVGKTAASLLLARHIGTEIISSDSMQIYRHMDIGTAKPTREELALVRHHMIDIVNPWDHFSTGAYVETVAPVMERLHRGNRVPLIVGGTGLYLKAMTRGIFKGPSQNVFLREKLLREEESKPGTLNQRLRELDPGSASRIMPNDIRRIIRALEVCLSGEASMSSMQENRTEKLPYTFVKIGLTRDREELYAMINRRVDAMLEQGLVEEVRNLLDLIATHEGLTGQPATLSSMQAIGYKELIDFFSGGRSRDEAIALIKQRSRNYAKRQFTWFRQQEPDIMWVDITGLRDPVAIFRKALERLQSLLD